MAGLIDTTTGLDFGTGLQFQSAIGGAGLQIVATSAFTPASLFTGGFLGDWFDATSISTLFQDSAKTTPVTADNDPVGAWVGRVNALNIVQGTAGAKPLYKSSNTTVLLDGVDDYLMTASNLSWAAYPLSLVALFDQSVNGSSSGAIVSVCGAVAEYTGLSLNTPGGSRLQDRGIANLATTGQSYPAASGFAASIATFASGDQKFRFNALTQASIAATNTHVAGRLIFGALRQATGTPSLFSAGRVQQLIVINKVLTATDQSNLLTYWGL